MNDYSKVYHVGFLNINSIGPRPNKNFSYEGDGLSVSHYPEEWTKIAKLGGGETYILTKDDPSFFLAIENEDMAIQWALDHGFIKRAKKFKAMFTDENDSEYFMELDSEEEALRESDEVQSFSGYSFDEKGKSYMAQIFDSHVGNSWAINFACVFYAQTHGYDGVWWHEDLDPSNYSAPRGVIFQNKINEWKIEKLK